MLKLNHQIFLAILLGAIAGSLTQVDTQWFGLSLLAGYELIGTMFINALKMVVVPLITTAIITSLASIGDSDRLGRLGLKTVAYYFATSLLAIITGLLLVNLVTPGISAGEPAKYLLGLVVSSAEVAQKVGEHGMGDFAGIFLDLFPPNLIDAAANGQMLGLIVFSLLFGYYLRALKGDTGRSLKHAIQGFYDVIINITLLIIRFTPLGVFALIAAVVTRTGFDAMAPLMWFFMTVLAALLIHAFVVMPLLIYLLARRSPFRHIRAMTPALLTAFSTASSAATLPLTMECVEQRAGVSRTTSSFVLPLGATVNMDGTALYECVAALFIAQAYGMDLSFGTQFMVVFIALVTSIGVAGIPAASLVAITVILGVIGLPLEAIGMLLVTDRVLDMCRTAVNVWGDSVCAVLLARSEGEEDVLRRPVVDLRRR